MSNVSKSLILLTKNEQPWAICSGGSEEMSDVSVSLISLTKKINEWVNCSFFWANRSFANFWTKNEQFAQKSNERISSPENYTFVWRQATVKINKRRDKDKNGW